MPQILKKKAVRPTWWPSGERVVKMNTHLRIQDLLIGQNLGISLGSEITWKSSIEIVLASV